MQLKTACNNKLQPKHWLDFNVLKHSCKCWWLGVNSWWSMPKISGLCHLFIKHIYSYLLYADTLSTGAAFNTLDWNLSPHFGLGVFLEYSLRLLLYWSKNRSTVTQSLPILYAFEVINHIGIASNALHW